MGSWRIVPSLLVLATLSASPVALAQPNAKAEPEAPPVRLAPEREEVGGTCATPRQAWLQHLWWAGEQRDFVRAALCFDTSQLAEAARQAPDLAQRLLEHLDAEGRFISTSAPASANPDYLDPVTKRHEYRDPAAPEFLMVRQDDGRWLLSAESLARIPEQGLARRLSRHLPEWLRGQFLTIEVWKYLAVLVLVFIALVVQRITVFVFDTYVKRMVARAGFTYLRRLVERANRPIGGLSMAGVFYIGVPLLLFPIHIAQVAVLATRALAAFSLVWLAYRLIEVLGDWLQIKASSTDSKLDDQLVPLLTKALKVFVSVLGAIFVLQNLNVRVGSLLAGVGLGGLAFALAAKDTIANFFGSVMIFVDKPFQIGDWVVIDGCEGNVEEVGFRTTRIRTFYNSLVTMPNSVITSTNVDNYGARRYRRYKTHLGLTYDTPPEKMQAFCEGVRALIAAMPAMRKDYYIVEFHEFGESGLQVLVYCFFEASTWNEELRTRSHLNLEILRLAAELGVSFAFPTRTLHVDSLVAPGDSRPAWSGSKDPAALRGVVESFGPRGAKFQPEGFAISRGYDCGKDWSSGSADED